MGVKMENRQTVDCHSIIRSAPHVLLIMFKLSFVSGKKDLWKKTDAGI